MRAAVARDSRLEIEEVDDPVPGSGHVLVKPLATGICGSDLHALMDVRHLAELTARVGGLRAMDPEAPAVFGHEFCAEIVDFGPDTQRTLAVGSRVCSVPILFGPDGVEGLGYSSRYPGALAEYMLLQEGLLLPVADHLESDRAALTEPLAVGEHAVGLAKLTEHDVCLVIGCGPVGLAVIAALKARGHGPVLAADFSSTRRQLAEAFGADEVIDPAEHSPHDRWASYGISTNPMERVVASMMGGQQREAVIFEAVGVPGMIDALVDQAPPRTRIVVVGVCMQVDHFEPFMAIMKEIELHFAFGYSPEEYARTLQHLEKGELAVEGLVTDVVGLDQTPEAFATLRTPEGHGKIIVHP